MKAEEKLVGDNIAFEDGSVDEQDDVVKAIDKNTVLMVSFEMLDFDLHSSTSSGQRGIVLTWRLLLKYFAKADGCRLNDYLASNLG